MWKEMEVTKMSSKMGIVKSNMLALMTGMVLVVGMGAAKAADRHTFDGSPDILSGTAYLTMSDREMDQITGSRVRPYTGRVRTSDGTADQPASAGQGEVEHRVRPYTGRKRGTDNGTGNGTGNGTDTGAGNNGTGNDVLGNAIALALANALAQAAAVGQDATASTYTFTSTTAIAGLYAGALSISVSVAMASAY
jgi:hypothetical protein